MLPFNCHGIDLPVSIEWISPMSLTTAIIFEGLVMKVFKGIAKPKLVGETLRQLLAQA
jgi:hypothetical protein